MTSASMGEGGKKKSDKNQIPKKWRKSLTGGRKKERFKLSGKSG